MEINSDIIKKENKFIFMFPGQGSQYESMGNDFLNAHSNYLKYFEISSEIIGRDLRDIINNKNGNNTGLLDQTQFSQIAIYSLSCALNDYLIDDLNFSQNKIGAVIGHSLGDYGALYGSGVFDYRQGASIVAYRGKMMGSIGKELEEGTGKEMTMAAVLGADTTTIKNILEKYKDSVFLANYNDYLQVVISGIKKDVVKAGQDLKSAGAKRIIELKVNIASHCPLMREASKKLTAYFDANSMVFGKSKISYFSSTEVEFVKDYEVMDTLVRQLVAPVKWVDSIENLLNCGFRKFIEVGPGKVLSGLVRRIASKLGFEEAVTFNTDSLDDLENLKNYKN